MSHAGSSTRAALSVVAQQCNVGAVERLLADGACVDEKDDEGRTALMYAVASTLGASSADAPNLDMSAAVGGERGSDVMGATQQEDDKCDRGSEQVSKAVDSSVRDVAGPGDGTVVAASISTKVAGEGGFDEQHGRDDSAWSSEDMDRSLSSHEIDIVSTLTDAANLSPTPAGVVHDVGTSKGDLPDGSTDDGYGSIYSVELGSSAKDRLIQRKLTERRQLQLVETDLNYCSSTVPPMMEDKSVAESGITLSKRDTPEEDAAEIKFGGAVANELPQVESTSPALTAIAGGSLRDASDSRTLGNDELASRSSTLSGRYREDDVGPHHIAIHDLPVNEKRFGSAGVHPRQRNLEERNVVVQSLLQVETHMDSGIVDNSSIRPVQRSTTDLARLVSIRTRLRERKRFDSADYFANRQAERPPRLKVVEMPMKNGNGIVQHNQDGDAGPSGKFGRISSSDVIDSVSTTTQASIPNADDAAKRDLINESNRDALTRRALIQRKLIERRRLQIVETESYQLEDKNTAGSGITLSERCIFEKKDAELKVDGAVASELIQAKLAASPSTTTAVDGVAGSTDSSDTRSEELGLQSSASVVRRHVDKVPGRYEMADRPIKETQRLAVARLIRKKLGKRKVFDSADYLMNKKDERPPRVRVIETLIKSGADIDATDNSGKSVVVHAVESGDRAVVEELFRGALDWRAPGFGDRCVLFAAAALGDLESTKMLLDKVGDLEVATKSGRTVLSYAAECGQADIVGLLIASGARVDGPSDISSDASEAMIESPIILAGRRGHMHVFRVLVEAGASVNVRSHNGETPLTFIAKWDFSEGVQLLVAHGGSLGSGASSEKGDNEQYSLIPASIVTMERMCTSTFEFSAMCSRFLERLSGVCAQLQQRESVHRDTVVTFASILFRFCRLLLDIKKRSLLLLRFVAGRALTDQIRGFHEELGHFVTMVDVVEQESGGESWKQTFNKDRGLFLQDISVILRSTNYLNPGAQQSEAAEILQYELEDVLTRFDRMSGDESVKLPEWFVSRGDIEFHRRNLVRSEGEIEYYAGSWRKTSVMIETTPISSLEVCAVADKWSSLSHPNVLKLFRACDTGPQRFFVYEMVPSARPVHELVGVESNRTSTWKPLFDAALGLQYLHAQGVVHGDIRSENIEVGSDGTARLACGVRNYRDLPVDTARSVKNWMAPEVFRSVFDQRTEPLDVSLASDIYAFGMCVWEVMTRELPWHGVVDWDIDSRLRRGRLPSRPESMDDEQWDLVTKMCAAEPSKRVKMSYVVNRLKRLVDAEDSKAVDARHQKKQLSAKVLGTSDQSSSGF